MADCEPGTVWSRLQLVMRSGSKESLEYILQVLWRTRRTGIDATDRDILRSLLSLPHDSDLDPLLVCLRILIRRCVYENFSKDEIPKLFPPEVFPELQRLLTLMLQKFQGEWQEDVKKEKASLPRLKAMTWNMAKQGVDSTEQFAVVNLKLQSATQVLQGETNVKFSLPKENMGTLLQSLYLLRDQLSNREGCTSDMVQLNA